MAIDFPGSPSTGQRHSHNNTTWEWDGSSWNRITIDLSTTDAATLSGIAATQFARRDDDNIITGVTTFIGNGYTGVGNTVLIVEGDARVTGVLSVGQGSVSINERDIYAVGVVTGSNFKTGTTNVHNVGVEAAGINVLGADTPIGTGATVYNSGLIVGKKGAEFQGVVTASSFVGDITGNSDTCTTATRVTVWPNNSSNATHYITFADAVSGSETIDTDTGLTYNPSTNTITASSFSGTAALAEGLTGTPDITVRNVTVTGIQTAEDVKNIDSIGIITARTGIDVTGGTFKADGLVGAAGSVLSSTGSGINWVSPQTGPQGAAGAQGAQGRQGAAGVAGAQGAQGRQGAAGSSGGTGAQGVQGAVGAQGHQGRQGADGAQGAQGRQGAAGAGGAAGAQGAQGYQGVQGSVGIASLTISTSAPSSPDAGDMWWDSDDSDLHIYFNDGSSSQWVNINSGTAGVQGATGAAGAQGAQGHQGVQGAAGSNGAAGAQGAQGHQGVQGATGPAPTSGGANFTSEVDISDGTFLDFGNGGLKIRTNSNNAYITEGTSGKLAIQGSNIEISNSDGDEVYIYCTDDGAVDLYHNNEVKLTSTTTGITVKDTTADHAWIGMQSSAGICGYLIGQSNAGTGSEKAISLYNSAGNEAHLQAIQDKGVLLYYNNVKKFETTSAGVSVSGSLTADGGNAITLGDSKKIVLGTGSDFEVYHDGGNSWVREQGTGALYLDTNGSCIKMTKSGASETMAAFYIDGAVELYHNNVKKFATNSDGVDFGDNVKLRIGDAPDYKIYHNGSNTYHENYTGDLFIKSDQMYLASWTSGENYLHAVKDGRVALYYDNVAKLETTSSGVSVTGHVFASSNVYSDKLVSTTQSNSHSMYINARNAVGTEATLIKGTIGGAVELNYNTYKKFETTSVGIDVYGQYNNFYAGTAGTNINGNLAIRPTGTAVYSNLYFYNSAGNAKSEITSHAGNSTLFFTSNEYVFSSGGSERWMSNSTYLSPRSTGALDLGASSRRWGDVYIKDSKYIYIGDGNDLRLYHDGSNSHITNTLNSGYLHIKSDNISLQANSVGENMLLANANGAVTLMYDGSTRLATTSAGITVTGEVDATSDIKLKENIKTIENSLDKVLQLRGVEFDWKESKDHSIGVIAQEVEEVLPELVHETDDIKSVSYGNITAVLIEAIKEQNKIINTMKKEIEELKG